MRTDTSMTETDSKWTGVWERLQWARAYSFHYDHQKTGAAFQPAKDSHDEGPYCGLSLGGIGTGTFGRDLRGFFSRWQLDCGRHYMQEIPAARFCLRWSSKTSSGFIPLGGPGWADFANKATREVDILFPVTWEHYQSEDWPFEIITEMYSPVLPGNYKSSMLPVAHFDFYIRNKTSEPVDIDIAFFWPNLLGWNPPPVPIRDQGKIWPDYGNTRNINHPYSEKLPGYDLPGVLFCRDNCELHQDTLENQMLMAAAGQPGFRISRQTSYYCGEDKGLDSKDNRYGRHSIENQFQSQGKLPDNDHSWPARWNEPLGGAISAGKCFEASESDLFSFHLVWDFPLVRFGSGRCWEKKYTSLFSTPDKNASNILKEALKNKHHWRDAIDQWQKDTARRLTTSSQWSLASESVRAFFNELYFVLDGGSAWVEKAASKNQHEPVLGSKEHFAILEGYDDGYWFYNTEDIWPYAMLAFSFNWPHLADIVFEDLLEAIQHPDLEKRMIYRSNDLRPVHLENKIPHDIGSPADDPWHQLNAYNINLDSNSWKDHNSSFIIAFYLHKQICPDVPITFEQYKQLEKVYEFILSQDLDHDGLPEHNDFGDSTWDKLGLKGLGSYTGGLSLASLSALKEMAKTFNDSEGHKKYGDLLAKAKENYVNSLWQGEYFQLDTEGQLRDRIVVDALFGPYMASMAGLGELVDPQKVRSHLQKVYEYNFKSYSSGRYGPVLTAQPGSRSDDQTQSGEVLAGSAWIAAAMMHYYGLSEQAREIAGTISRVIYEDGCLQFRTPAAWNNQRIFRAPMNLRPLAVAYIDPVLKKP
jgi:uncharacterized protein (DUF608 family)